MTLEEFRALKPGQIVRYDIGDRHKILQVVGYDGLAVITRILYSTMPDDTGRKWLMNARAPYTVIE